MQVLDGEKDFDTFRKAKLAPIQAALPTGYFIEYSGQFESQQRATRVVKEMSTDQIALELVEWMGAE